MLSLRINRANRNICPSGWVLDTQKVAWNDHALWLVHHGYGRLQCGEELYAMRAGGCFFLRSDRHYIAGHDGDDRPLLAVSIHFDFLDQAGNVAVLSDDDMPRLFRQVDHVEFLWEIMERITHAWKCSGEEESRDEAHFWLHAALKEVARLDRMPAYSGIEKEQREQIEQICSEIQDEPGSLYRVDALARRLHIGRHHFARVFKKVKGVTPREYIVTARMDAAKSFLETSTYPIQKIAELVGYRDIHFFSRHFRQKTGQTPTRYRKS